MDFLHQKESDICRINKYKPVATLQSRTGFNSFKENYNFYTLEEKKEVHRILAGNGINLYKSSIEDSQYIFYSKEFLLRLCNIFNISLDDGLRIVSSINKKNDNEMYFINCGFNNIIILSSEHKINDLWNK